MLFLYILDLVAFVGLEAMQRVFVFLGPDRHRFESQFVGRAKHADGDLGTVGDKDLRDCQVGCSNALGKKGGGMISGKMLQCN